MRQKFVLERISIAAATAKVNAAEKRYKRGNPKEKGIEPHVRQLVIALTAHGFPTMNSCEGHLEGRLYPWVLFANYPKGDSKESHKVCLRNTRGQIKALIQFVWQFESKRFPKVTDDRMLKVTPMWGWADSDVEILAQLTEGKDYQRYLGYQLECHGAEVLAMTPAEVLGWKRNRVLTTRRDDCEEFAEFLIKRL